MSTLLEAAQIMNRRAAPSAGSVECECEFREAMVSLVQGIPALPCEVPYPAISSRESMYSSILS
jgi:hypothetical protein